MIHSLPITSINCFKISGFTLRRFYTLTINQASSSKPLILVYFMPSSRNPTDQLGLNQQILFTDFIHTNSFSI